MKQVKNNMVKVNELYVAGEGWVKVEGMMKASEIFRMMKAGKVITANVVIGNKWWGLDLNEYNFVRKFEKEIMEDLILSAEAQKQETFSNFRNRRNVLTSYSGIDSAEVTFYKEGMYFYIDGSCHTSIKFFMDWTGTVKRKPRNIEVVKTENYYVNC